MVITNDAMYIINAAKSIQQKHRFPLSKIDLLVTNENDKILLVRVPEEFYKKDKVNKSINNNNRNFVIIIYFQGDLIVEVPNVIETCTKIVNVTKRNSMLFVEEKKV